jgi:hypothetical protein
MTKAQDVVILLKLVSMDQAEWSYAALAESLFMSPSEVHAGVRRAQKARLYSAGNGEPLRANLAEFLIHGVKYSFPAETGARTRGLPTAHGAGPLRELIAAPADSLPPVWPYPEGTVSGLALAPLYKSVPRAALVDERLYRLLALLDAVRGGRVREQRLAAQLLKGELGLEVPA